MNPRTISVGDLAELRKEARAALAAREEPPGEFILTQPDGQQERWSTKEAFLRGCVRMAARATVLAAAAREEPKGDDVEIVALYLAEREHGGPCSPDGPICEGYKDEARMLVARLTAAREDTERPDGMAEAIGRANLARALGLAESLTRLRPYPILMDGVRDVAAEIVALISQTLAEQESDD